MKNALFIRLDRMGDLILTLPCDRLVSEQYNVHWVTPKGLDFVMECARPQKKWTNYSRDWSFSQFFQFYRQIRKLKIHTSVCFHVPWWVNLALWLARVPVRGGVQSQWHSYLFLNKGLRQKRSRCEHHEMEYNYLLVEHTFELTSAPEKWASLELAAPSLQLNFDTNQNYFVVHPGMGGSALNWPIENYAELIEKLSEKATVVITGTPTDEPWLSPLKILLKENNKVVWLDKQLNGSQLLKLLHNANAVVAPSTGVLHLSASLGAPSVGLYSPIKVHQSARWGPKGKTVKSLTPTVQCPAHFECLKQECPQYFCMDQLSVDRVLNETVELSHSL